MNNIEGTYSFPEGIPAFEDIKTFDIVKHNDFYMMTGADGISFISFVCIPYSEFSDDYPCVYSDEDYIINIITISEYIDKSTVNLKAPIILNTKDKTGRQIILDQDYAIREILPDGIIAALINYLRNNDVD